jgi:virginiamycin B lyase
VRRLWAFGFVFFVAIASASAITITDSFVSPSGVGSFGIVTGPDGNLWVTAGGGNSIFRVTPAGAMTRYVIPTAGSGPSGIAAGPDGNLWFTETGANQIGRISPVSGTFTEFPLPAAGSIPSGIAAGPDGALWFAEAGGDRIGRITTSGTITEYPLPPPLRTPGSIVSGSDGALWFTLETPPYGLGRITIAGAITSFPAPGQVVRALTAGSDGALWFSEFFGFAGAHFSIARMATDGTLTEFPLPEEFNPVFGLAFGSDGNLWLTDTVGVIARMNTSGTLTRFRLATQSYPYVFTSGPDGNVWFTEGDYIGKIDLATAGYYAITPCRLVDTRRPVQANGGPALSAGETRLLVSAGHCGTPLMDAYALAVNVTVVNEAGDGDLRLFPANTPSPSTSTINFVPGKARANNAIVPIDLFGQFQVFCDMPHGGTTDFIVDVVGYFY